MNKKITKKSGKKVRNGILRGKLKKPARNIDKTKLAFQEIRREFKRLKKSKQNMQVLWYRMKKEHVALMKDLDKRIKELKTDFRKRKPVIKTAAKKRILRKTAAKKRFVKKSQTTKAFVRNKVTKTIEKKAPAPPLVLDQSAVVIPEGNKR